MKNGTIQVSWRLGVVITVVGSIIGGAFWVGRFTGRIDDITASIITLTTYSQKMGVKVDLLRERQVADDVGDQSVERRLVRIEGVLVRIEELIRERYRQDGGWDPP